MLVDLLFGHLSAMDARDLNNLFIGIIRLIEHELGTGRIRERVQANEQSIRYARQLAARKQEELWRSIRRPSPQ